MANRSPPGREGLAADRWPAIFGTAWRCRKDAPTGRNAQALLGKHLALLHEKTSGPEPSLLQRAAQDLGARVSHVHLGEPVLPPTGTLGSSIPKVLGRLYDALDASSLPPGVVRQIALHAGVPVYEGLDRDDHPIHAIAALLALRGCGCEPGSASPVLLIRHAASTGDAMLRQA
ncbi:MAG: hypothetical protein KKC85_00760, partial [Gammaproteobacteria bacterium]|nr:hypothetical protein [Gammaproteobacteria bacterium]